MRPGRVVVLSVGRHRCRGGRRHRGLVEAAAVGCSLALLVAATVACSTVERDGIRVVIDVVDGNRMVATGAAVEAGRFCAEGVHQATGHEDRISGEALTPALVAYRNRRILAAEDPEARVDYLVHAEWTCSDGSGTLLVRIEPAEGGAWEITGGRGAHAGLTGGGIVGVERPAGAAQGRDPVVATIMELRGVVRPGD